MRWQRVARYLLVAAGVSMAVAVYVYTRPRPAAQALPAAPMADPKASMQSGQGVDVRTKNGKDQLRVEYDATRTYPDGRFEYEHAHVTLADGADVRADLAELQGKGVSGDSVSDLKLTGHVHFTTADGMSVQGESGTYSDTTGIANIPGPVTFTRGHMSGTGNGGTYAREAGVFRLLADAHLTITGDSGASPVEATAQTLTYTRAAKTVLLEPGARITREAEVMTADQATLLMTDDEQQFRSMQLRGNSKITPAPGKASDLPEMQAADIDLTFYPGGQAVESALLTKQAKMILTNDAGKRSVEGARVYFRTAPDGKTLTRLESTDHVVVNTPAGPDAPPRTITAAALVSTGDARNGLTAAQFTGGIKFVEDVPAANGKPASKRTGTAQTLSLVMQGQFDAIQEAQFQTNTTFQAGDIAGNADRGVYFASASKLELRPFDRGAARRPPHVTDGSLTVDAADVITVFLDTNNLDALRDVKTSSVQAASASSSKPKHDSALFNTHDTVYGFAAELHNTDKVTRYVGSADAPARLIQGDTEIIGHEVVVNNDTQDLNATGKVESKFLVAAAQAKPDAKRSAAARPTVNHAWADTLVYRDADRVATYTGAPARLKRDDTETEGSTIVLTMAEDSQTLDRLLATGKVYAKMADDREATADSLLYEAALGRYTLQGSHPAVALKNKEGDGSCSINTGTKVIFNEDSGTPSWPDSPGGQHSRVVPCNQPIR